MQKFEFLWQPLLGELALSRKREEERENNAIYSGHLRLCQQPRAAHALRSDQFLVIVGTKKTGLGTKLGTRFFGADYYEKFGEKLILMGENEFFGKFPYDVVGHQTCPFHILKVSQG